MATEEEYIAQLLSAKIEGFKSIKSIQVDFTKGINVIIGKNATGKSNFIKVLSYPLKNRLKESRMVTWNLEFKSSKEQIVKWEKVKNIINIEKQEQAEKLESKETPLVQKFYLNNKIEWDSEKQDKGVPDKRLKLFNRFPSLRRFLRSKNIPHFRSNFIWYNIPDSLAGIETPISVSVYSEGFVDESNSDSINIMSDKILFFDELDKVFDENKKVNHKKLDIFFSFDEKIKSKVRSITPIEDFRVKTPIIYSNEEKITFENIIMEFKINNEWMPWSWLSDGTRRLFYIVTEVAVIENGIIFIEEPELGIHPHQFHELLSFLKEEAHTKQIIISTHSPKTLDCLTKDELSHIIITKYDKKKGTQLRHLTSKEQKLAAKYMDEVGYLSDYWLYSELEA